MQTTAEIMQTYDLLNYAKAFILATQYEVPFIRKSEATKRSRDRKENEKDKLTNSTAILGNVKL